MNLTFEITAHACTMSDFGTRKCGLYKNRHKYCLLLWF